MLTKSQFTMARECPKKLWLTYHMPETRGAKSAANVARSEMGQAVGVLARGLFDGVAIPVSELSVEAAAVETEKAMAGSCAAIFEATFIGGGLAARVDILVRAPGGWRILEVKSSGEYDKAKHLHDVAFQAALLKGLGIPVVGACLVHLNKEYRWAGGPYDPNELFAIQDIGDDVGRVLDSIAPEAEAFARLRELSAYPPIDGDPPYYDPQVFPPCGACDFQTHCGPRAPSDHVYYLGLHHARLKKLLGWGIRSIGDVPHDFDMSPKERLRFDARLANGPVVSQDFAARLDGIRFPAHFIDFEALHPELPIFPGNRPFQLLPFQWSCHTLDAPPSASTTDPGFGHREFLHQEISDPRAAFVRSLLEVLSDGGSIVHYHSYERNVVNDLVREGVPGSTELEAKFDRFFDLCKFVDECYADPRFLGKSSIKNVLPVVAPDLSYKDLAIQNGEMATIEYERTLTGELSDAEASAVYENLKTYCKLDTWAMVRTLMAMQERALAVK